MAVLPFIAEGQCCRPLRGRFRGVCRDIRYVSVAQLARALMAGYPCQPLPARSSMIAFRVGEATGGALTCLPDVYQNCSSSRQCASYFDRLRRHGSTALLIENRPITHVEVRKFTGECSRFVHCSAVAAAEEARRYRVRADRVSGRGRSARCRPADIQTNSSITRRCAHARSAETLACHHQAVVVPGADYNAPASA